MPASGCASWSQLQLRDIKDKKMLGMFGIDLLAIFPCTGNLEMRRVESNAFRNVNRITSFRKDIIVLTTAQPHAVNLDLLWLRL